MGLRITESVNTVNLLREQTQNRTLAARVEPRPLGGFTRDHNAFDRFPARTPEDTIQIGFGENTVSPPGAAVRTLGAGIRSSRALVDELEAARERIAEQRQAQEETAQIARPEPTPQETPQPLRDLQARRADAVAATRAFLGRLNETARRTEARLQGEQILVQQNQPTIRIGEQNINPVLPATTRPLDILA